MSGSVTDCGTTPLRIMLVDDDPQRADWVERCLKELGFEICARVESPLRLLKEISDQSPDVIIVDMQSPGRDVLESLSIVAQHQPTPVVMFSEEQDPDYINRAVESGVSTYLVGSIDPAKVRPVIQVAMAQFRNFHNLKSELSETKSQLTDQQTIDAAKRLLMRKLDLDENTAYRQMREQAMRCSTPLRVVAQQILEKFGQRSA